MTIDELHEVVREAVRDALRPEAVLDRAGICGVLGISDPTLTKLIDAGLPHFYAGDHKRFERAECIAWLKARRGVAA